MKNFRLNLIYRIILLSAILAGGFFLLFRYDSYLTLLLMAILTILSVSNLIKYIDTTNRDLARFLISIKYSDFSQSFGSKKRGASFQELSTAINDVMDAFRKTRAEKEEQYRFLQTVLRHINIGLFSYDQNGKFEFINKAARQMLGISKETGVLSVNNLPAEIRKELNHLKPGTRIPVKLHHENDLIQLIVYSTEFRMREQQYTLVSLQNIQLELEEKELEAWQKLIRVLTHEIMNSVTPISSLASTVNKIMDQTDSQNDLNAEQTEDIKNAVKTIEKRSAGLIDFVNSYRNLTKITKPEFQIVNVRQLFDRICELLKTDLEKEKIDLKIEVDPATLEITADLAMIEQVLINLIFNAIHALKSCQKKSISLRAELNQSGKTLLKVSDNGPGIPEEIQEKIFIPFFSTKKDGSGIGLSLSRQILRLHKGSIKVISEPDVKTTFVLTF